MPENTSNIRVGDTLTVIDHAVYCVIPDGKVGDQHRVTEVVNDFHVLTEPIGDAAPISTTAHTLWFVVEGGADGAPARPLIDFSASRYATARQYAEYHVSRVNKPETNEVLGAVRDGKEVDAYALARAVTDAMRGATTRAGQSMARRQHATEIAHLGHIAHAVIENHADGLPAYAEGERSRQIEALQAANTELRADREALKGAVEQTKAEIERSTEALADEVRAHAETRASADAEATRLVALAERRQEAVDAAHAEMNEYSAALDYAFSLLNDEQQQRLAGFRDGYGQRVNDEA